MEQINFIKMHGLGNDFVLIDMRKTKKVPDISKKASAIADRKTGIGCDQLLLLEPSNKATAYMRVYNSDGSLAETCGNGLRCVAGYLKRNNETSGEEIMIDTAAGLRKTVVYSLDDIEVDMGEPQFDPKKIPIAVDREEAEYNIIVEGLKYTISCVSLGNPHCVIIGDGGKLKKISQLGPEIERDPFFPNRTNVEIVEVVDKENIEIRIWERGAGQTKACGSGATAAMVVCRKLDLVGDYVKVRMPGGDLSVRWDRKGNAFNRGPATLVFEGKFDPDSF